MSELGLRQHGASVAVAETFAREAFGNTLDEENNNINEEERDEWIDKNPFTPNVDPRPANAFKNLFSDIEKLKLTIKCVYILLKIEKRKAK